MIRFTLILILSCAFPINVNAESIPYTLGGIYCTFTHPSEMISPVRRSTCEKQHVIQQQSGGGHQANTVWWAASSHVRTDIWNDKPWENSRPWLVMGFTSDADRNLEKAYMLGTFGMGWSLFQHNYSGGDSSLILSEFDGVSNALYLFSWVVNLPQKYLNKVAYIVDKGHWHLLFDMVIALFILTIEGVVATLASVAGLFIGTVLNPVDTLCAIPGGLWLAIETLISAVWQFGLGIWRIATSGLLGLVLSPFAVVFSFLPFVAFQKSLDRLS